MKDFTQKLKALYPPLTPKSSVKSDLSVAFVLAPSFTMTPFAGFLDVLRLASDEADYSRQVSCHWTILGDYAEQQITSSSGTKVAAWKAYQKPEDYQYIIVVGGQLPASFDLSPAGYAFIARAHRKKVTIIALCVGSFLVARLGLLNDYKCAVGFGHEHEMKVLFPAIKTYSNRLYLEDNNIITCPGGVAAIDLANQIVTQHCGKARSIKTMRSMLIDNQRKPAEMPGINYQHVEQFGNWQTQRAISYMENHLNRPIPIARLAEEIGISQAALNKSFQTFLRMTPLQFWKRIRLEHAKWLLLNTEKPVSTISDECGFYDAAHFSRSYKAFFDASPLQTRKANIRMLAVLPKTAGDNKTHEKITRFYNRDGTEAL